MPRLTSAQLRTFNAVYRNRSVSRAAEVLKVSQPAVTAQIRSLESGFGVRLFLRDAKGVQPTGTAVTLFDKTQSYDQIEDRALSVLTANLALTSGTLRIAAGAPNPAMGYIAQFSRKYPGVEITTRFGNWDQVVNLVAANQVDLGMVTGAPDDDRYHSRSYVEHAIMALVPLGHPLATRRSLSFEDLTGEKVIFRTRQSLTQSQVEKRLSELGLTIQPSLTLDAREAIYEAVAQGMGIGFMFDKASTRTDGVARIPIRELRTSFTEDVFCLKQQRANRPVEAFFELMDEAD